MPEASILDPQFVERLTRDSGAARFAVIDRTGTRLLHLSPAAAELQDVLALPDRTIRHDLPARERLMALAGGAAGRDADRPERLRLGRLAPPVTCLCRLVRLEGGEDVLLLAFDTKASTEPELPEPRSVPAGPPPARLHGTVRFVWQADAQARFVQVSPALAEIVGEGPAEILGRTVAELDGDVLRDPGDLAGRLERRETFSGHAVFWRVGDTQMELPVDMAGAPIFGPERALAGFRGFGLIRTDAARRKEPGPAAQEPGEAAATAEIAAPLASADSERLRPAGADASAPEPAPQPDGIPELQGGDPWSSSIRDSVSDALSSARDAERLQPSTPAVPDRGFTAPPGLTTAERSAFREIARALGARFDAESPPPAPPSHAVEAPLSPAPPAPFPAPASDVLDRLPAGVLVHRGDEVLFANRLLLDLVAYDDVGEIAAAGGVTALFRGAPSLLGADGGGSPVALTNRRQESIAVEVRLAAVAWDGLPASAMLIRRLPEDDPAPRLRRAEAETVREAGRARELEAILDTATDGVIVLDEGGRILSLNRSAEALFGYDQREVAGDAVTVLFAPESHRPALDYLDGLRAAGMASLLNDGREVLGRVRQGGAIPLFMTMGTISEGSPRKFCAVLRDITAFKTAEGELVAAKRAAEEANAQKSDLLAKISHEIRTPLSAIIGFAEVMLEERFGPIGNERYKDYLKDVHTSGAHVISLVNDLLDLAKIEAGRMDLSFTRVSLNELVAATVTLLQPQAARDRIVMRTSFAPRVPPVVADERSIRQIVLNLVSNAIKFTDAGGQVIVSTAPTDRGEVAFRVRDTGIGMTQDEIEQALEPFRQVATARKRGGTGLGLPLTKALVEANRGALRITSNPNEGTLVEVIFPPTRVLAG